MNNLKKWLTCNDYTHKPTFYAGNYFYNAPEIRKEAAEITIISKNIKEVTTKADKLRKYARRYNYKIMVDGRLFCNVYGEYTQTIILLPAEDAAALDHYNLFANAAANECEILIHEYHETGKYKTHAAELNNKLKIIMDNYGAMYNRSLIKIAAA